MLPGGFSRSVLIILGLIVASALGFFIARSTQDGRTSQASVEQVVGNASTPAPAPTPAQTSAGGNWPSNLTVQVPPTSSPAAAALPAPANDPGLSSENGPALTQMARAFLARPEQDRAMQAALRAKAARLPGLCSALSFVPGDTLVARTPFPMFDAAGVMRRGLIRQRFTGAGCPDAAPRFNIWVFAADPVSPIKTVSGYMGATRADPPLQRDATPIALTIAARLAPGCDTMSVIDTRLPKGASTPPAPGPWAEEWLIAACGRYVQLTMHFVPEANGTTRIEVPSSEAKLINVS